MKRKKPMDVPHDLIRHKNVWMPRDFPEDPMGSYTGQPMDPFEQPVQDADDL